MPDIFLSYSRQDLAVAAKLADALVAAGHNVWWDQALKSGEVYDRVTETALREARVVVVLWSPASVASDWVRSEATVAMQRGALLPAMIEACQRPVMFELRQSADLTGWKGNAKDPRLVAFLADVARQLAVPADGGAAPLPVATSKPGPDRRMLIGGAAGGLALAAGGYGAWKSMGQGKATNTGAASIAVLPFANLSGDPAQAYFSDGIAEELRSALATIAGLKVAARTSSELMRDTDIKEAATKLGVVHVLTGSVRRGGGKIRVTAQLLDGVTGLESWSQVYDRPAGDVLEVQTGIAQSVANALSLQFGKAAAMVGGTKNPVAYDAYLRADSNQFVDQDDYRTALADLNIALSADPNFGLAHARLALLLVNMATRGLPPSARAAMFASTIEAAERAIELAPTLRIAYATIGRAHHLLLEFKRAATAFAKAATLPVTTGRGLVLEALFQSEYWGRNAAALAIADQAVALDPLNQVPLRNRVRILMDDRQSEAALATIYAWDATHAGNPMLARYRIRALMMMGRPQEAAAVVELVADDYERFYWTAAIEAKMGNRTASDAALAALQQLPGPLPTNAARIRAMQGEGDMAFAQLALAVAQRDPGLARLRAEEAYDPLRKDPRFLAIEKQLGFPPV